MTQLTLTEALSLPAFRRVAPEVLTTRAEQDRAIRWAHATERTDVHDLLRPGDLLLTMGIGLPDDTDTAGLDDYARSLAEVECAGLVVELGKRWSHEVPPALVSACDAAGVPLVVLRHEARFAALTQAIGEHVVETQLAELREAERVHETFTELSFSLSGPLDILEAVRRLTGGPVVLENAQHRPLDYLAGREDMTGFLDDWQQRSRRSQPAGRTAWDADNGWLVTRLGTVEQGWGRLVIGVPAPPTPRLVAVAERAAAALALHRLHDRHRDNLVRRTHRELLDGLKDQPHSQDVRRRAEVIDFPVHRRRFVAMVVRLRQPARDADRLAEVAESAVRAAHTARTPALVCEIDHEVVALLSLTASTDERVTVDRVASRLYAQHDVVIAAGRVAQDATEVGRSLKEAGQVADAVPARAPTDRSVHRLEDLHLRGLLSLFGHDERITLFVERELAPLRAHDAARPGVIGLMDTVRALVRHPEGKSAAAASLHLSRAAFYDRLAKVEEVLGVDLDDPDVRISLHVALIADDLDSGT